MGATGLGTLSKSWRETTASLKTKSRGRFSTPRPKPPEEVTTFFIDRNLSDPDLIAALRAFEFTVISHHDHYTKDNVPDPQRVPDEDIIPECASRAWVLITADQNMEYTHFTVIKTSAVQIFIVPDNCTKPIKWAEAMLKGRSAILRAIKNYASPFVGRINSQGVLHQLRCFRPSDSCPKEAATLIKDGKIDHECARKNRRRGLAS